MRLTLGYVESLRGPSPSQTHRILSRTTGPARDIRVACGMRRPPESSAGAPRMKAVILAAGEGARMGPFTASVPKVMIPLGNRPLLEDVLQEGAIPQGDHDLRDRRGERTHPGALSRGADDGLQARGTCR